VRSQSTSDEGKTCWAVDINGQKRGNFVSNEASTKVNKQLGDTTPLQTLAKGDKLTVTVEGIDGGKLRRDLGRCRSGPPPTRGSVTPRSGEDDFEAAPDEGGRQGTEQGFGYSRTFRTRTKPRYSTPSPPSKSVLARIGCRRRGCFDHSASAGARSAWARRQDFARKNHHGVGPRRARSIFWKVKTSPGKITTACAGAAELASV
jgi:hypothetical protein